MEFWLIVVAILGWLVASASGHTWIAYVIYTIGFWFLSRSKPAARDDSARETDVTLK